MKLTFIEGYDDITFPNLGIVRATIIMEMLSEERRKQKEDEIGH